MTGFDDDATTSVVAHRIVANNKLAAQLRPSCHYAVELQLLPFFLQ